MDTYSNNTLERKPDRSRTRLSNRRASETSNPECRGLCYACATSRFADGRLAEVFLPSAASTAIYESLSRVIEFAPIENKLAVFGFMARTAAGRVCSILPAND